MQKIIASILGILLVLPLVVLGTAQVRSSIQEWVTENTDRVRALVLFQDSPDNPMPNESEWIVTVRILGGYNDDPEFTFTMRKAFSGATEADVRWLNESIRFQLRRISNQAENRRLPVAAIAEKINYRKCSVRDETKPELRKLATDLEGIRISAIPSGEIAMDATVFEISLHSQGRNFLSARFELSEESARTEALIQWIVRARDSLKCPAM